MEAGVVCGCRGTRSRRARVVKGMDSKPIVISRAGSGPAVDAKCRMVEVYERRRKDRCWLGGQLFFLGDLSCYIKPHM